MVAQLNLFVDLILKKLLLLILNKLCLINAHSTLNNRLIVCLLQLIKYSIAVVKIVNKLLLYNFVLGHFLFVYFTIQFTWGNALKSLLIDAILLERYCGHPLDHILVIQNVFYLLCCPTFHIYFMICFWSHSFYYEAVFYYLIHILIFIWKFIGYFMFIIRILNVNLTNCCFIDDFIACLTLSFSMNVLSICVQFDCFLKIYFLSLIHSCLSVKALLRLY